MEHRVYRYRQYIQWGQYLIPPLFGFVVIVLAEIALQLYFLDSPELGSPLNEALLMVPVLVGVFGWLLWRAYYQMAGAAVSIEEGKLVHTKRVGTARISLNEISCLEFSSTKYFCASFKVVTPTQRIKLTMALRDIAKFALELKEEMDAQGLSDRYDRNELSRFLRIATRLERSALEVGQISWSLVGAMGLSGAFWAVFGVVTGHGLDWFIMTPLLSTWPSLIYLITEAILARRSNKATDEISIGGLGVGLRIRKRVYRKAIVIGFTLYLVWLSLWWWVV